MASCLPLHDEVNTKNGCIPTGPGFNGYCTYDLDQIEPGFETMTDMDQTWLDQIVDMDEIDDLDRPAPVDTPAPSTPYPCTDKGFSPDQLAYEISKLYIQEMNSEFNPIPPLTNTEKEPDDTAWQSPPLPKKLTPLTRYTGGEHNMTYLRPAVEETTMQVDDEEWQVRVYDELLARLTHVQDKTTEKWLGRIDYDDGPYRFKVFEYFDQDFWSASSSSLSSASDYPCLEGEKQQQQQQRHISFEEDAEENVLL
jgi:hypothetical protein